MNASIGQTIKVAVVTDGVTRVYTGKVQTIDPIVATFSIPTADGQRAVVQEVDPALIKAAYWKDGKQ